MEKKAKKSTSGSPIRGELLSSEIIFAAIEKVQQEKEEEEKDIYLSKLKKTLIGKEIVFENYRSQQFCI